MLPDFLSMLGARPPRLDPGTLKAGVLFHHQTDAHFHECTQFRRWQRESLEHLTLLGVRRGPARAIAHAGVELLVDLALARSLDAHDDRPHAERLWQRYDSALLRGRRPLSAASFSQAGAAERLRELCARLLDMGRQRFRAEPQRTVEVLERALSGRPRLEMSRTEVQAAKQWAKQVFSSVKAGLPDLLSELEKSLDTHAALTGPVLEPSAS